MAVFDECAQVYDARSNAYARSLVLVMVPAFALGIALLVAGKGAPFVAHLVFSMHVFSWYLVVVMSVT